MPHWLLLALGLTSASGRPYLLWSGVIGDGGIIAAIVLYLKHKNCAHRWCWRIGRHPVAGSMIHTCRRHHPVLSTMPRRMGMAHIGGLHHVHTEAVQAAPEPPPACPGHDDLRADLAKLSDDISGLAEAIRLSASGEPSERIERRQ